ncbi:Genetic interactor of prohibitin 7, mitochondrial [Candida viswanathii]|uniref:Genetic interactor of prohibitin 7, mitochondrial n=1 Tax=Candida viswanathii TaxID=5486 RepID=A0A367YKE7_9ASCO|nr:Genetic interactor of prohibitin 7, mitochondrial [Candida viswanathii]
MLPRTFIRRLATQKKLSPDEAKRQATQLAVQSLKDFGSLLSNSSEETQPINTAPVFEDPRKFASLSLLHQGQVLGELQEKYDKNWNKLSEKEKKLGYFIAYGDWGVREKFSNWDSLVEPPLDLPFEVPSRIKTTSPGKETKVGKLPEVKLSETPVRRDQFNVKRMDGVTKFFIYLVVFISMVAFARDKNVGESGKPKEIVIEDKYEIERQKRLKQEEEERVEAERKRKIEEEKELARKNGRKWYYLWLK